MCSIDQCIVESFLCGVREYVSVMVMVSVSSPRAHVRKIRRTFSPGAASRKGVEGGGRYLIWWESRISLASVDNENTADVTRSPENEIYPLRLTSSRDRRSISARESQNAVCHTKRNLGAHAVSCDSGGIITQGPVTSII